MIGEFQYQDDAAGDNSNLFVITNEYEHLENMFKVLEELTADNLDYFLLNEERSRYTKFVQTFQSIINILSPLRISLEVITGCCAKFDLKPTCKGNGYRSIINIVESCLTQVVLVSEQVQRNRDKLFFRSYQTYAELDSYAQVLARLLTIIQFAIVLLENSEVKCLFPKDTPKVNGLIEDMMDDFNNMSRECFYGRSFGFQYALTVRQSLQVVGIAMAAYGDGYIRHTDTLSRAVSSVIHSGKYLIDPELRAKRIAELTQEVDIKFCKAFWSLPEEYGVQHAPLLVCPAMDVNLEFTIPSENLTIKTLNGKSMEVKLPLCHEKQDGVKARLLSFVWRDGQIHNVWKDSKSYGPLGPKPRQRSRYLMFHCHGGGFVAQSSKSHEIYLRTWAKELRIPILSIDYSLAPEAVFPQALNEIFYAYVWALNNFKKLGTTGEKIIFTGDSAGACLVTALTFKAIMRNIRLPDGLVLAYPPYRVQYYPSPSRILCLMDPLLPLGVLKSCIQAYAGDLKAGKNISKKVDLLKLTSNVYNPFSLDFGEDHWDVSHSHHCGQFHSLSETNLDMIKDQLAQPTQLCSDDEYFSDGPVSDFDSSCSLDTESGGLKRTSSYGNVFKRTSSEDVIAPKKSCRKKSDEMGKEEDRKKTLENVGSSSSLFLSLKSQVSSQVFDLTSRVSSRVFDDIKSSVTQQIPSNVLDISSKMFDDIKSGFTNFYERQTAKGSNQNSQFSNESKKNTLEDGWLEQEESTISPRKRVLDKCDSNSSVSLGDKPKFLICKECLHPSANCNCNMRWTGKIVSTQRQMLGRFGSRHSLSGKHHMSHLGSSIFEKESNRNAANVSGHSRDGPIIRESTNRVRNNVSESSKGLKSNVSESSKGLKSNVYESPKGLASNVFESPKGFKSRVSESPKGLKDNSSESPNVFGRKVSEPSKGLSTIFPEVRFQMVDKSNLVEKSNTNSNITESSSRDFKNPLMSPIFASDELLNKMPPVAIFACSLDPLFDDSVEFIRKLQNLNKDAELHVLDQLPHGFLNLQVFSPEAHDACTLMVSAMKKSLDMGMRRNDSTMLFPHYAE